MPTITRRSLIVGTTSAAAIAAGFPNAARSSETITLNAFRALSARLTGTDAARLNPTAAAKLLDGFISLGRGPELDFLDVLKRDEAWYTILRADYHKGRDVRVYFLRNRRQVSEVGMIDGKTTAGAGNDNKG